jgi:hypothetical protein
VTCVNPGKKEYDETLNTLLFAARAMAIPTFIVKNEQIVSIEVEKELLDKNSNLCNKTD